MENKMDEPCQKLLLISEPQANKTINVSPYPFCISSPGIRKNPPGQNPPGQNPPRTKSPGQNPPAYFVFY